MDNKFVFYLSTLLVEWSTSDEKYAFKIYKYLTLLCWKNGKCADQS